MVTEWTIAEIIIYKDDPEYNKKIAAIEKLAKKYKLHIHFEDADNLEDLSTSD